jgi:DNA primase
LEGRLSADIRVLTLPLGQDPDDLIRQETARWAILVDEAKPLVEHYMNTLLQGQDLADPKVKTDLTESLVPVIRQVSSPVERAHYAQKLARVLRVDERALLDMVASASRRRQRRRRQTEPAQAPAQMRSGLDLETYCLRGLLHVTELLSEVNEFLTRLEMDPILVSDFQDSENREIFRVWSELTDREDSPSFDQLEELLPVELHGRLNALSERSLMTLANTKWLLEAQVERGQDAFDLKPDEVKKDLLLSLLKLRERSLLRKNTELRFLLEETDETDARLYQRATGATITALSRLQRTMSSWPSGETQLI